MDHFYYYDVYGLCAKTNVPMPLLEEKIGVESQDIAITVSYGNIQPVDSIVIKKENDHYIINLGKYADYLIFTDRIMCIAEDFDSFFSTVFNIPFAVFFTTKQEKLLHCCSMFYDNSLVCFVGEKGVGKSTLTQLIDGTPFQLFSDDTLRIANNHLCYRANNLIKLTAETITHLGLENLSCEKNVVGKTYGIIPNNNCATNIRAIIQIKQRKDVFLIEKITDPTLRRAIYLNHTVGLFYYPSDLFYLAYNMNYDTHVSFFQILLPHNIEWLTSNKDSIINTLNDAILFENNSKDLS